MKGFSGFGAPKRRLSLQFGYDSRPSFWHRIKCNAHLVIAGVGTAALLCVVGAGLWLAMPASERQAFAEPKRPAATAEAAVKPAAEKPAARQVAKAEPGTGQAAQQTAKAPEAKPTPVQQAQPEPQRSTGEMAFAQQQVQAQAAVAAAAKAIVADDPKDKADNAANPDAAPTAAIPTARPDQDADAAPQAGKSPAGGSPGHIRRAVTMRAGPKKGAAALATLPAKTAVQVISCDKWCQVVYKGKTGWIYKSYLDRDG